MIEVSSANTYGIHADDHELHDPVVLPLNISFPTQVKSFGNDVLSNVANRHASTN